MAKIIEEQLMLDIPGLPCGKMSQEHCQQEQQTAGKERHSNVSSRNSSGANSKKLPLFLYLKTDGQTQEQSYSTMGSQVLLGESLTYNTSDAPKDGEESLFCAITMDYLPQKSCLSNILQAEVDEKYRLSVRACQGILARANKRGKQLPEPLLKALMDTVERQ